MSRSGILQKAAVGLGALAVPVMFGLAGAGQASADDDGPGGCITGPFGYASACLNWPGVGWWVPHWDGWHGGGDWEGDD